MFLQSLEMFISWSTSLMTKDTSNSQLSNNRICVMLKFVRQGNFTYIAHFIHMVTQCASQEKQQEKEARNTKPKENTSLKTQTQNQI